MITVTLDLTCSICGHQQFHLPIKAEEGANVCCANCSAFKCKALDLERALTAMRRSSDNRQPAAA